jgi:hypothetical protein
MRCCSSRMSSLSGIIMCCPGRFMTADSHTKAASQQKTRCGTIDLSRYVLIGRVRRKMFIFAMSNVFFPALVPVRDRRAVRI